MSSTGNLIIGIILLIIGMFTCPTPLRGFLYSFVSVLVGLLLIMQWRLERSLKSDDSEPEIDRKAWTDVYPDGYGSPVKAERRGPISPDCTRVLLVREDNSDKERERQAELSKIKNGQFPYSYDGASVELKKDERCGDTAVCAYANGNFIGRVSPDQTQWVLSVWDKIEEVTGIRIYEGARDHAWGDVSYNVSITIKVKGTAVKA